MKTTYGTIICLAALTLISAHAQPAPGMPPQPLRPPGIGSGGGGGTTESAPLTKFSLDFPGGTPKELVTAIEKASGRPLNAIIPDELSATKLPPLKMKSVDVSQLFQALELASRKVEYFQPSRGSGYSTAQTGYGFKQGSREGLSDDTIWYFYSERPVVAPVPPVVPVSRFYSLAPYLDLGVSVDDITTAIETGWKMLGEKSPPKISFHKDTKLLIAVGEPSKLETIDAVLKALGSQMGSGGYGERSYPVKAAAPPQGPPKR